MAWEAIHEAGEGGGNVSRGGASVARLVQLLVSSGATINLLCSAARITRPLRWTDSAKALSASTLGPFWEKRMSKITARAPAAVSRSSNSECKSRGQGIAGSSFLASNDARSR